MIKDLKQLTNKKDRINLFLLFVALLLATLIEMVGIGSVPIFAMIIIDPETILNTESTDLSFFIDNLVEDIDLNQSIKCCMYVYDECCKNNINIRWSLGSFKYQRQDSVITSSICIRF